MARVVGEFQLLDKLGSGLQGKVYRVRHTTTGNILAAKLIDQDSLRGSAKMLTNLQREITAMERVAVHPYVIGVRHVNFDVAVPKKKRPGVTRRCVMIVMDIASGGELFDYLMLGRFEEVLARTYFKQLLEALHFAHGNGVVHRDIKPENLLLGKGFELRVADWGLSAVIDDVTTALLRSQCGTRAYMAPEILRREAYRGEPADMWSSGVVMFIMLSGFPPFEMAAPGDWWYDRVRASQYGLFWQAHERAVRFSPEAKDLLNGIFVADPSRRLRVEDAMKHPWCNGPTVDPDTLLAEMGRRRAELLARKPGAAAAMEVEMATATTTTAVTPAAVSDVSMTDVGVSRGGDLFGRAEVVRAVELPDHVPTMARISAPPAAAPAKPAFEIVEDVQAAPLPADAPAAARLTWFTLSSALASSAAAAASRVATAADSGLRGTVAVRADAAAPSLKLKVAVQTAAGPVRFDVRIYDVEKAVDRAAATAAGVPADAQYLVDVQRTAGDCVAFNAMFGKLRQLVLAGADAASLGESSDAAAPGGASATAAPATKPAPASMPLDSAGSSFLDSTVSDTLGVV